MIVLATARSLQTLLADMYAIITLELESFGGVLILLFSQHIVYKQDVVYLPSICTSWYYTAVFLFKPVHRQGHPENILLYCIKLYF